MLKSVYQNFSNRAAQWGVRRALYWQLMHACKNWLGFNIHYVKLGSGMRNIYEDERPTFPEGYQVKMVCLQDLLAFADSIPDMSSAFLKTAFGNGDLCVASFCGAELVGISFESGTRAPVTRQLELEIPKGIDYIYKTWIHPQHRQKNLSQVQGWVRRQSRGVDTQTWSMWYVETHNYPSLLHSYLHPRERRISGGLIGWVRLFGREFPFRSPRARWLGIKFAQIKGIKGQAHD